MCCVSSTQPEVRLGLPVLEDQGFDRSSYGRTSAQFDLATPIHCRTIDLLQTTTVASMVAAHFSAGLGGMDPQDLCNLNVPMSHLQEDSGPISLLLGDSRADTHQRSFDGHVEGVMISPRLPPIPASRFHLKSESSMGQIDEVQHNR